MVKSTLIIIIVLCVLIVGCLGVTIWSLFFRDSGGNEIETVTPDYPPEGTESNQTPIEGDETNKFESPTGGGAINVTYGGTATASLSNKTVQLYYANPGVSNQDVAIVITVSGTVVAKSDHITPGHQVTELPLEEYAAQILSVGGYDAELTIRAYDPITGEKAMVDTKGQITLTVTD